MAKTKQPIQKHPDTIAWEAYKASPRGVSACDHRTLGSANQDFYLTNRLEAAFMAGVKHGESKKA